jgi:hypothetical protein
MTKGGWFESSPGWDGVLVLLTAVVERFRIERPREFAFHVIEYVSDGVFGEALKPESVGQPRWGVMTTLSS